MFIALWLTHSFAEDCVQFKGLSTRRRRRWLARKTVNFSFPKWPLCSARCFLVFYIAVSYEHHHPPTLPLSLSHSTQAHIINGIAHQIWSCFSFCPQIDHYCCIFHLFAFVGFPKKWFRLPISKLRNIKTHTTIPIYFRSLGKASLSRNCLSGCWMLGGSRSQLSFPYFGDT